MNRKRTLRILGTIVGGAAVAATAFYAYATIRADARAERRYDVPVAPLTISGSPEALARGEHLVRALAKCTDCHGDDLGGKTMVDDGMVGTLAGPNITRGGVGADLTTDDWVRAIAHGVGRDGRPLAAMPAKDYSALGESDVADIIAYVRSAPPVERTTPPVRVGPALRIMMTAGSFELYAAESVDHARPMASSPRPEANAVYGEYLARTGGCFGCHGPNLRGGAVPGMPPGTPKATDISPSGVMATWTKQDFANALRLGRRPDGSALKDPMPWQATARMTDTEVEALYLYLKLPATNRAVLSAL
ncbi:MAG: c-type cytochrome [Labilithrix sp.]|nr:c-type cytochrome [Labilithrix sp.]MBX3220447.1 c-type cytochrome [Labilithrix sp.]